ncbi:MAG: hypothetical protein KC503_41750 [Myxococcales bacterium]|nr:hypothetical protein [Myxococcales bacterium]
MKLRSSLLLSVLVLSFGACSDSDSSSTTINSQASAEQALVRVVGGLATALREAVSSAAARSAALTVGKRTSALKGTVSCPEGGSVAVDVQPAGSGSFQGSAQLQKCAIAGVTIDGSFTGTLTPSANGLEFSLSGTVTMSGAFSGTITVKSLTGILTGTSACFEASVEVAGSSYTVGSTPRCNAQPDGGTDGDAAVDAPGSDGTPDGPGSDGTPDGPGADGGDGGGAQCNAAYLDPNAPQVDNTYVKATLPAGASNRSAVTADDYVLKAASTYDPNLPASSPAVANKIKASAIITRIGNNVQLEIVEEIDGAPATRRTLSLVEVQTLNTWRALTKCPSGVATRDVSFTATSLSFTLYVAGTSAGTGTSYRFERVTRAAPCHSVALASQALTVTWTQASGAWPTSSSGNPVPGTYVLTAAADASGGGYQAKRSIIVTLLSPTVMFIERTERVTATNAITTAIFRYTKNSAWFEDFYCPTIASTSPKEVKIEATPTTLKIYREGTGTGQIKSIEEYQKL